MLTLTLTEETGSRMVRFPVPWSEVTLGQYARMQGKEPLEQVAILAGVELEDVEALSYADKSILLTVMETMGEIPQEPLAGFPDNIGLESIGQFELAKKFIEQFQDENEEVLLWDVAPFLLAIYLWPGEYDLKAGFYAGFPKPLVDRAKALPITQAAGAIVFFSANCNGFQRFLHQCLIGNPMQTQQRPGLTGLKSTDSSAA